MEKFKISDIQEIFTSDVERFHSLTQQHVTQLLSETPPAQESLDEALRQCHTLKGLAATVQAWGLSCLGADLEKLLELAGSWMHNDREKANGIFEFILDHMQDWYVMNQFTCMDMLPQAWDVYQGLRGIMVERWPGYLAEPAAAAGDHARYVRLHEVEIPELPTVAAHTPQEVGNEDGGLRMEDGVVASAAEQPTPDLDVKDAQPMAARVLPGAPTPLRVVPPTLRQRIEPAEALPLPSEVTPSENIDVQQSAAISSAEQLAAPTPLRVVPPTLRQRDHSTPTPPGEPVHVPPAEPAAASEPKSVPEPIVPVSRRSRRRKKARDARPVRSEPATPPEVRKEHGGLKMEDGAVAPASPSSILHSPSSPLDVGTDRLLTSAATAPAPPILRVAPPALKRRANVQADRLLTSAATAPAVESTSTPALPLAVEPSPIPPVAADAPAILSAAVDSGLMEGVSAEDVFAGLPASAEVAAAELPVASDEVTGSESLVVAEAAVPSAEAGSVAEFKPAADEGLLELLGQELAACLAELSEVFAALAGNLVQESAWERARRLFHTIKGTSATFNLESVSGPALAGELCCVRAGEAAVRADATFNQREAFETCLQQAQLVAEALHLPFGAEALREALEAGLVSVADLAAASAVAQSAPLDSEMAGFFINDVRDQIAIIEQAVLRWEKGEQPAEQVAAAQRGFHTIKGAGNSIGLTGVAQSVHEVEALLEGVAGAGAVGSKPLFAFLLGAVDQLRRYLVDLGRNAEAAWRHDWQAAIQLFHQPAKVEGRSAAAIEAAVVQASLAVESSEDDAHTLRIEAARLYQVMNLIGEMVIDRARLARKIEQLTVLHRTLAERNRALTGAVQSFQQQFEFNLIQKQSSAQREGVAGGLTPGGRLAGGVPAGAAPGSQEFSELEFDRYDQFNVLARSLVEISHDLDQLNAEVAACLDSFSAENVQFTQTSQQLQSKVTSLSMVPVHTLFPRLQRAFRDALQVEHKEAELSLAGGQTLLDKVLVDKIYPPLLHLLRNAVAHGIESPEQRLAVQKPPRGVVRFSALTASNQIVIQLADDGAGVDAAAVRLRAVERGWLPADALALSPEQVVDFIFQPGFSTASTVTSLSGRGIGLDVVRQEIENLNGSVELEFVPGQGCTWSLRLPLTLSISEAILASVGGLSLAFPLNFIERGLILEEPTRCDAAGREWYPLARLGVAVGDNAPEARAQVLGPKAERAEPGSEVEGAEVDWLPVVRLAGLLQLPGVAGSNKGLIVGVGERRAVVVVDVVLGRQEVVNKQLDSVMAQHPLLNGATLDAEGRVIPILNVPSLLKFAESAESQVASSRSGGEGGTGRTERGAQASLRVLIVDDSLSVRKVQERFLRELGCEVVWAADGLGALERLREGRVDFVFTDLEMPRLNGYELISELRGNPAWAGLPVVVVSSRGADKYVTKAMNLGATSFLTKPFSQVQLAEVLRHYGQASAVVG